MTDLKFAIPVIPLDSSEDATVHWLPFAAQKLNSGVECNVPGYFTITEDPKSGLRTTFRGRNLRGIDVETGELKWYASSIYLFIDIYFHSVINYADRPSRAARKLVVWNHDDTPLKSDVVQQAVNLARVQNYLGSGSGIA